MVDGLDKLHPQRNRLSERYREFQVGCDISLEHLGVCILDNAIHRATCATFNQPVCPLHLQHPLLAMPVIAFDAETWEW